MLSRLRPIEVRFETVVRLLEDMTTKRMLALPPITAQMDHFAAVAVRADVGLFVHVTSLICSVFKTADLPFFRLPPWGEGIEGFGWSRSSLNGPFLHKPRFPKGYPLKNGN